MEQKPSSKIDALYTILEQHLYNIKDTRATEDEGQFIDKIVNDYLHYLTSRQIIIPKQWQKQIVDELRDQVRQMMVRKMYGCLSLSEYVAKNQSKQKKSA